MVLKPSKTTIFHLNSVQGSLMKNVWSQINYSTYLSNILSVNLLEMDWMSAYTGFYYLGFASSSPKV